MGNESSSRIWDLEGAHSFISDDLRSIIREIDTRLNGSNVFSTITRVSRRIVTIDYYLEVGRTNLLVKRNFTYVSGRISQIESVYYNSNASIDSTILEVATRSVENDVDSCDSTFSTTEDTGCA